MNAMLRAVNTIDLDFAFIFFSSYRKIAFQSVMYVMCMHVSLSLPTNIFWIILFGVCGMYGSHRMRCCCDFMLKSFNSSLISYHNRKKDCKLRKRSNARYTPPSFQIQQDFMCTSQLPYKNRTSICIHKSCSSALQPNYFSLRTTLPHTSKPPPAATTTMAKSSPSNATKEEKKPK